MQHRKRYREKNDTKKHYHPTSMWAAKEKNFDTRKGLKKFLKRKFGQEEEKMYEWVNPI